MSELLLDHEVLARDCPGTIYANAERRLPAGSCTTVAVARHRVSGEIAGTECIEALQLARLRSSSC
jgi:hypothetical protein